jgi:hypothetical protein
MSLGHLSFSAGIGSIIVSVLPEFFGGSKEFFDRRRFDTFIYPFDKPNFFIQIQESGATNQFVWGT